VQVDRGHAWPLSLPETPGILSLVLIVPVDTKDRRIERGKHRETETGLPILSQLKVEERRDRKPDSGRQDRIFWGWMNYRLAASSLLIRSPCSGVKSR
jgi:hypothetical protein